MVFPQLAIFHFLHWYGCTKKTYLKVWNDFPSTIEELYQTALDLKENRQAAYLVLWQGIT